MGHRGHRFPLFPHAKGISLAVIPKGHLQVALLGVVFVTIFGRRSVTDNPLRGLGAKKCVTATLRP